MIKDALHKYVYYEEPGIVILHGDSMEIMPQLATSSIDLVLTDPPYQTTSLKWDRWPVGWLDIIRDLLAPSGSLWCFGALRMFMTFSDEFRKWTYAQEVIWEKHNGSNFHNDRFRRVHDIIAQFYPSGRQWSEVFSNTQYTMDALPKTVRRQKRPEHMRPIEGYKYVSENGGPRLMRSVIKCRSCHGYAIHPTQKPVDLLLPLIEYSVPPKGLILDPFGGSCSTAEAAKKTGRRCIVIEQDKRYLPEAVESIKQGVLLAEVE